MKKISENEKNRLIIEHKKSMEALEIAFKEILSHIHEPNKKITKRLLNYIKINGLLLRHMKRWQTPEICLTAVKQNGMSLRYVKDQTFEICLAAVQQNGLSLQFVEKQTPKIVSIAIKQNKISAFYDDKIFEEKRKTKFSQLFEKYKIN